MSEIDKLRDEVNAREHKAMFKLLEEMREDIHENFVNKSEFKPVRAIAYGLVAITTIFALRLLLTSAVQAVHIFTSIL